MSAAHTEQAAAPDSVVEASPLRATLARNRHRTAIARTDYSRPIRLALLDGVIGPDATVLDYGCGLGDDVRHLRLHGTDSRGWDPVHLPDGSRSPAQVVNLGYVVNVIEDADERAKCLECAWACAERVLIVSARLASQTRDFTPVGRYADGFVTSVPTFQKLYYQNELKTWIEAQLGEPALAGGPGVFYVFRDPADRMGYLASRFRGDTSVPPPSVASSIDAHKELVQPLIAFFRAHGRTPVDDEISNAAEIRERLGSLHRALRLVQRAHDPDQWHRIITARGHDLCFSSRSPGSTGDHDSASYRSRFDETSRASFRRTGKRAPRPMSHCGPWAICAESQEPPNDQRSASELPPRSTSTKAPSMRFHRCSDSTRDVPAATSAGLMART